MFRRQTLLIIFHLRERLAVAEQVSPHFPYSLPPAPAKGGFGGQSTLILPHYLTRPLALHEHINSMIKRSGTNEFAGIHKENFVGILDSIQPVRNDYTGRSGG